MAQILESLEEKISSHSPEQRFIAEQLGVKIGSPNKPNFDELEPGVYLIETSRSKGETISLTGHAIAYIKLKNHGFLFDPNLGTVYVPKGKDAEYIQHCLNNIKHDTYTLARCTKRI